jgi:hypothetical protein
MIFTNSIRLLKKNKEAEPSTYEAVYGSIVEKKLEENGYTSSKIQAIINNYLAEPDNEKYIKEFQELQECRKQCKREVKDPLNG